MRFAASLLSPVAFVLLLVGPSRADEAAPPEQEAKAAAGGQSKSDDKPRKIVLIAGPRDERHGPGTHEYDTTVKTIREALEGSNVAGGVKVETVLDGWPENPAILDDADTIFLVSAGADHKKEDHPFLVGDRMKVLSKQMDRGCGLVLLHWSVFVPIEHEKEFTRWVGGFFDYQRGDDPRGWYSAITFATAKIHPNQKHAIGKGVPPFEHRDEYYYRMRFKKGDKRVTPIVTVELPEVEEPQVVAWAVERKDGGRGFAFTGGHFQKSWEDEAYRTLMLNAICWTAKVAIPAGGVHKQLAFDDQWTPKPHLGKEDLPKEKEEDWVDGRIRESDTGPVFTASMVVPETSRPDAPKDDRKLPPNPNRVTKALAIRVGGEEGLPAGAVLFDKERMVLRCGWTGGFLNHSDRRFGLLEMPAIGGEIAWATARDQAWLAASSADGARTPAKVEYRGLHMNGERVVLDYEVDGRAVRETPSLGRFGDETAFIRTLECSAIGDELELPVVAWPGATLSGASGEEFTVLERGADAIGIALMPGVGSARVKADSGDAVSLVLPGGIDASGETAQRVAVAVWQGPKERARAFVEGFRGAAPQAESIEEIVAARRPRWGEPLVTRGEIGAREPGTPLVVDTVTIPYKNRFKALFFLGGFDFAPDGTCYVCTAHGDVWKVTGIDEDLGEIRWQRFATGLYEPLGLKIRSGEIFVLGRDQITRLHDENGDGEADFYECFNDDLTDSGQAHAYAMCLETDSAGNFYFIKSGAPETRHGGTLLKVSADGKTLEVHATGFRHANGLGIGPDDTITAADNEGNWVPVTRVDVVERGAFCGHVPTAHLEVEPTDCGTPLCWLPRVVDNSAGGQVWVPEGAWGPLSGALLHLSFGQCTASVILKERVEGVWQGGAVRLPTPRFLSGVCRGRFRTSGDGADGHLYVCGLDGWSSEATEDGCLQRVRHVGGPLLIPTDLNVSEQGIELRFAEALDRELASNPVRYAVDAWNYRWSKDYGSKDYSAADPTQEGRDALKVTGATLSSDGRSVLLAVEGLTPVMQLRVQAGLKTAAGAEMPVDYYGTVHRVKTTGEPKGVVSK